MECACTVSLDGTQTRDRLSAYRFSIRVHYIKQMEAPAVHRFGRLCVHFAYIKIARARAHFHAFLPTVNFSRLVDFNDLTAGIVHRRLNSRFAILF